MKNVEIDFVVTESRKALELYEKIFDVERIEVTDLPKGENEVIFFNLRRSLSYVR